MIKRLIALWLSLFICPAIAHADIVIPFDATTLVSDYLIPYLENDPKAALAFGAELNISNGPPDTRDYGERGMFGKLVSDMYVLENYPELEAQTPRILEEVKRLLLGPWENGGYTVLSLSRQYNTRMLDYETGKWIKTKYAQTIRVEHYTELRGKRKVAHIAYSFLPLDEEGNQGFIFSIVRK